MNLNRMLYKIANEVDHRMGKINSSTSSIKRDIEWVEKKINSDVVADFQTQKKVDLINECLSLVMERLDEIEKLSDQYQEIE